MGLKNNAEGSVFKNIRSLRDENQFFDVTLMCEDGEIFSAHKVVLASQSEKFKLILSHMTMSQALVQNIYMSGVPGSVMSDILDFMYVGEVKISQDRLMKFLNTAHQLHVYCLTDKDSGEESSSSCPTIQSPLPATPRAVASAKKTLTPSSTSKAPSPSPVKIPAKRKLLESEDVKLEPEPENGEIGNSDFNYDGLDYDENEDGFIGEDYEPVSDYPNPEENEFNEDENDDGHHVIEYETSSEIEDHVKRTNKKSIPSPSKIPKKTEIKMPEDESNKILLENLKLLGLSKLSRKEINNKKSRDIVKRIMSRPTPKLPCPVAFMNYKQLVPFLQQEVLKNIIEQGKRPLSRVWWGDEQCHPTFWPDDIWPWHLVTNIVHKQFKKPKDVNMVETFKIAVRQRLQEKNLDPDTYISEEYTEEEDMMKKRARGIPHSK